MTENEAKSMPMLETSVKKQYPDLPANHMTFESHRSSSFSRVQALAGPSYGTLPRSKSIPGRRDPGLDAFHQIRAYSPVRGGKIRGSTASKVQSVRSLHCIDIFGENFHRLLNINDPYSLRTDLDTLIRKKNLATLLVAIVGIFLMIAENVINWDSENKEIISDNYTQALKVFTTLSTILLVFMIAENYRVLSFVVAGNCHLSTLNRFSLVLENHGLRFVLEIFVCLLHIPPYIDHFMQENPDKYGIFMFLRLYLGVKVLRDYSPVYVQRAKILQRMERSRTGTAFDGYLVHIRRIFFHYPGRFVLSMLAIIYPIMVFSIYLQEREAQDEFTFDASLWFTAVTMMTVGYGDLVAKSLVGRVCAVIAGVLGILLSSLCVAVMSGFLNLSRRQRFAVDWVSKAYLDECVENEAARVIQIWWRILSLKRQDKLSTYLEYKYGNDIVRSILFLRRYRKEAKFLVKYASDPLLLNRLQLEGRYDPVLDRVLRLENTLQSLSIDIHRIHDSVVDEDPDLDATKIRVLGGYERPPPRYSRPMSVDRLPEFQQDLSVKKRIEMLEEKSDQMLRMISDQSSAIQRVLSLALASRGTDTHLKSV